MTTNETQLLKEKFLAWLQEFNIDCVNKCSDLPSEFFPLFQSHHLKELWRYFIDHVKTEETSLKIKNNLALQELRSENRTLCQSCNNMSEELIKLNINIQRLEEKVKQKQVKCVKSSLAIAKGQKSVDSNFIKSLFHEQCARDVKEKQDNLYLQKQMLGKLASSQSSSYDAVCNEQQFYCCRDKVEQLLISIHSHYLRGHEGHCHHTQTTDTWKVAIAILKEYPPKMIVDAISSITRSDVEELGKKEKSVISNEDKTEVEDSPTTMIKKMLQDHHEDSLKEFQEAIKCETEADRIERSNARSLKLLLADLPSSSLTDREKLRNIVETEMRLKGEEAFLKSLQSSVQSLKHEIDINSRSQREVFQMQEEMKNFNTELARNKVKMVETTRQNADFLRGLPQKQAEVVDLADKILQSKVEHINEKSAAHQTVLKEERSALESADVSKLQTVEIAQKKIPVDSLAIYRHFNDSYECGNEFYQDVLSLLKIYVPRLPADVLRHITERFDEAQFDKNLGAAIKKILPDQSKKVSEIEDVNEQSAAMQQKHVEKMSKMIAGGEKTVQILKSGETKLEKSLTDWYEEPAQYQAPWLRVDGMDFKKWKQSVLSRSLFG